LDWNLATGYTLYYEYSKRHPYVSVGSQEEYIKITRSKYTKHQEVRSTGNGVSQW